jgi:ABC-type uncharacterized transport system ATPase subunit
MTVSFIRLIRVNSPDKKAKVILVIGLVGAGKTAFIKLATGADISVGDTMQAGKPH